MTQITQFNRLIIKNFLSFGSRPTEIDLRGNHITVVLGLNHDTGGDESRNGVGKSALIDALAYCLYGKSIRGISNMKLVNKLARKGQGMLVVVEFDIPGSSYRIERGEKPSRFKVFRKDDDDENSFLARDGNKFIYDVTRGKGESGAEIEGILGLDFKLFEFLIANSSESDAFMKLPEDKRRDIAERLMGLNHLSERAGELKEERKDAKKDLIAKESSLEATERANARIQAQINELIDKEEVWEVRRVSQLEKLHQTISDMEGVDADEQIEILKMIDQADAENTRIIGDKKEALLLLKAAERDLADLKKEIEESSTRFQELGRQKTKLDESVCPTCEQHWTPDEEVVKKVLEEIDLIGEFSTEVIPIREGMEEAVISAKQSIGAVDVEATELERVISDIGDFDLRYDSIEDASAASATLAASKKEVAGLEETENPHMETIQGLRDDALQNIDDSEVLNLRKSILHYNYLIELLQSKDSFLRKAVIDRWLPRLNSRIAYYLDILELPYVVRIENDLSMSIIDFGEEFDWGNLSKGQRQRVTIALNLAFQDLFETTNRPISLLMVDELIDTGICPRGAHQALQALREISESKGKRVFLITHRMDIADQIDDVMLIEMKNRISRIAEDEDDA